MQRQRQLVSSLLIAQIFLANVGPTRSFFLGQAARVAGMGLSNPSLPGSAAQMFACRQQPPRPMLHRMCAEKGGGEKDQADASGKPTAGVEAAATREEESATTSTTGGQGQAPAKGQGKGDEQDVDMMTFIFGKPGEFERDLKMMGTSRRRFIGLNLFALFFAFFANFAGVTSWALGLMPGLDGLYLLPPELTLFYPVKGWKRYVGEGAYEFIYPQKWLADQAVTFANAAKGQQDQTMMAMPKKRVAPLVSTSVAFGPPRGDSSENVSVVRSRIPGSFTLRGTLGEPELAAQRLLDTAIAPPGSGKQSRLIKAFGEVRGSSEVYQFEYVVTLKDGRRLHNACAIFDKDSVLYTLTVLCPEDDWDAKSDKLLQVAGSFRKV